MIADRFDQTPYGSWSDLVATLKSSRKRKDMCLAPVTVARYMQLAKKMDRACVRRDYQRYVNSSSSCPVRPRK